MEMEEEEKRKIREFLKKVDKNIIVPISKKGNPCPKKW